MKARDVIRWRGDMAPSEVVSKVPPQLRNRKPYGQAIKDILAFVETHPGTNVREVAASLGYKSVQPTLHRLVKTARLSQKKLDGMVRYYPISYKQVEPMKEKGDRAKGESQRMILEFITAHPGTTTSKITKYMGWSSENSTRSVTTILERRGLIHKEFRASKNRFYANQASPPETNFIIVPDIEEIKERTQEKEPRVDIQPDYRKLAQEYAWDNPESLGVLKHFVTWLEGRNAK